MVGKEKGVSQLSQNSGAASGPLISLLNFSKRNKKETASASSNAQLTRNKPNTSCQCEACQAKSMSEPGTGKHSDKWDRCVQDVQKKGSADNAYAVCTAQLGTSIEGGPGSGPNPGTFSNDSLAHYRDKSRPVSLPHAPHPPQKKVDQAISDYNNKVKSRLTSMSVKQSSRHGELRFMGRFREIDAASVADGVPGKRFRVTLLQEGLGNFNDAFYYTPQAIQSASELYEGKKAYIDHPSETEEVDRPERSVKDILGYFENVSAENDSEGRACLVGDLVVLQDPSLNRYRTLMTESISFSQNHPDEELVGLSINASGDFQTLPIDQFMKETTIPEACLPKLQEAIARGIMTIRPVTEMKSAVSCDLVTTAGAGGEINQLLEGEKMEKKESKEKKEAKEMEHKEGGGLDHGADGAPAADGAQDPHDEPGVDGQTGSHPDADQDEELIMKMLQKYLGHGFSDGDKQMMAEAYQNALEASGGDQKQAMEMAGHSMKLAKHMQSKAGAAGMEADAGGYGDGKALGAKSPNPVSSGAAPTKDTHIESNRGGNTVIKLTAEVAKLRQIVDSYELEKAIDKGLRESKLPMAATKKFRETCLKSVRTPREFQEKLAVFKEAFSLGGEAETKGFIYGAEKGIGAMDESGLSAGFGDCVEK